MGSSGCGKTTLLNGIIGITKFDSGVIEIFGEPPRRNKSRIGYMPQETALIEEFSVHEMIWYFGKIFGLSCAKIDERVCELTSLLELPDKDKLIRECSGGQQRRISFALSLVHEPELLILDEPTVGVDPLLRLKIWNHLVHITQTQHVTVLLTTHYIEEARQSTHVGIMRNGLLLAQDKPGRILQALKTASLDEAFLQLSQRQESGAGTLCLPKFIEIDSESPIVPCKYQPERIRAETTNQQSSSNILRLLVMKNFIQLYRNYQ